MFQFSALSSARIRAPLVLLSSFLATAMTISHSMAAPLSLGSVPLFVQNSAKSNLMMVVDDSGSMEAEMLYNSIHGYSYYHVSDGSLVDSSTNKPYFTLTESGFVKYMYLFPNGTGNGARVYTDHYALPPFPQFAFVRSSDFNGIYYDPMRTYEPWYEGGTDSFSDMSTTAAESDPSVSSSTPMNLTGTIRESSDDWKFRVAENTVIPEDTYYLDGSWDDHLAGDSIAERTTSSNLDLGIRYRPATYYVTTTSGSYDFKDEDDNDITGSCSSPDPSHYQEFERNPVDDISAGVSSTTVNALAYDGSCLTKVEIRSGSTYAAGHGGSRDGDCAADPCTYDEEIQNFANWFSYHRKRHLALRAGMGSAFAGLSNFRAGFFPINDSSPSVTMYDMSTVSGQENFFDGIYGIDGNSAGTPNRRALNLAGYLFNTDANIITEECQKNYTLFFTDGFSGLGSSDKAFPPPGNVDSGEGAPFEDNQSDTLGDIAMKYYNLQLRSSDFSGANAGQVPVDSACNVSGDPDTSLDCNANLHMNTYAIGLGAIGDIYGVTHSDYADAFASGAAPSWPTDVNSVRGSNQIDDLYHAAVNGRGEIYNAMTSEELTEGFTDALVSIQAQEGSATSVSFNTATLESDSNVFLALFNAALWTGDLEAYGLSSTGDVSDDPLWSASDELTDGSPGYDAREILTYNGSTGVPFRWANLTSAQQNDLSSVNCSGCTGQTALNFIRGDRSNEGAGKYRVRESLLGDIVNGSPVYVGLPNQYWPAASPFPTDAGETYAYFKSVQRAASPQRADIVYAGANDGMLHGFDADSGEEVLAYVPSAIFSTDTGKGLHYLTQTSYQHQFYVDQAPTVSDVYIETDSSASPEVPEWRTVLVGGLGAGGRGIFALDITDPSAFSEANADDIVLWEFTSATDSDLGYTFSKPTIAMMENGRWAAIFGNGYNSGSEQAKLFIVFLDGGVDGTWTDGSGSTEVDYIVLDTDATTSNGLSSARVLDTDGNGAADRVYAGDLQGRLWAFDLSDDDGFVAADGADKTSVPSWAVAYKQGSTPKPLFTAEYSSGDAQPITSKPSVVFHPEIATTNGNKPNLMVFVGTGQFLESGDVSSLDAQSFYGVYDAGSGDLERSDLVEQTISAITDTDGVDTGYRSISDNNISNSDDGWYMDLPASGERSVVDSTVRGDIVYFNTWIPSADPCDAGGGGYLMSVSQSNGGAPSSPIFDTNGDGVVDYDDLVEGSVAIGQEFQNGLPASSKFLANKQYTPGTNSDELDGDGGGVRDVEDLDGVDTGRLSWQELNR